MFWCDKCELWEHEKCLAKAVQTDYLKSNVSSGFSKIPHKSLNKSINIITNDTTEEITAYIKHKGHTAKQASEEDVEKSLKLENDIMVEPRDNESSVIVKCLKCGAQLK